MSSLLRHRARWGLAATLVIALASASTAHAALIDFESLGLNEVVTNQFAADGVVFGNAITLVSGITLNEFDFPPSSGSNVLSGLGNGPLTADLLFDVPHVGFQITTSDIARVRYFDSLNALLGEVLVNPNLGEHTLVSLDSPGISSVSVSSQASGSAFFLAVDDFEFSSHAVPEPTTVILMTCGLAPLVVKRRAVNRWRRAGATGSPEVRPVRARLPG